MKLFFTIVGALLITDIIKSLIAFTLGFIMGPDK